MENPQGQKKTQFIGVIFLLITAFVWGTSFVAQSVGSQSVRPFTFGGIRTLIGAAVLLPFILVRDKIQGKKLSPEQIKKRKISDKRTFVFGALIGIVLFFATCFQQFAFDYSTAGKIAFVTAMYMFFVPIAGLLFKKKIPFLTWICIALGFIGLYLLCFNENEGFSSLNRGDILAFICAIFFTIQILLIEKFAQTCDGIKLSCAQFFSCGMIFFILMLIFDRPSLSEIKAALIPILYSGVMSCGVAYTFQIIGQKYCEATIASLIMCMESVFATISSAVFEHKYLSFRETSGCTIMFIAILIFQIADIIKSRKIKNNN